MKSYLALLPLAAATILVGCGSRGTAQNVVGQAEAKINEVKADASVSAPSELKAAESTLARMKQNYESHDYRVVIADVPKFNEQLANLNTAIEQKQTATAAATTEWATLSTDVPKAVEEIQARVDSLKPNALPKDVTKAELATAKTELETLKAAWAEATAEAQSGKTAEAAEKGRVVAAKTEELKSSLGITASLAATPAAPVSSPVSEPAPKPAPAPAAKKAAPSAPVEPATNESAPATASSPSGSSPSDPADPSAAGSAVPEPSTDSPALPASQPSPEVTPPPVDQPEPQPEPAPQP
jgi:hypothetical protein